MPYFRIDGQLVHLKLGGPKSKQPKPCVALIRDPRQQRRGPFAKVRCLAVAPFLCDWPVEGGTCDAPLCTDHAAEVRPGVHYCPHHLAKHREQKPDQAQP